MEEDIEIKYVKRARRIKNITHEVIKLFVFSCGSEWL